MAGLGNGRASGVQADEMTEIGGQAITGFPVEAIVAVLDRPPVRWMSEA